MKKYLLAVLLLCSMATWGNISSDLLDVKVRDYYKYRPDKQAGREILLTYRGDKSLLGSKVEICSKKGNEITDLQTARPDSISVLLPPTIGVETNDTIIVSLLVGQGKISREVIVPALRHWTVYIYPHSHVDIGYTNTQENVEFIHKRNLDVAMDLIEETASYPEDARFVWNPEVTWPVERYLATEPKEKRERLLKCIRNGSIAIDAGYISTNTSAANEEELLKLFHYGKKLEKEAKYQWEFSEYLNRDICQPEGFDAYGYPSELFKLDMERLGIAAKRKPAKVIDFAQYIENNRGTND